MLTKTNTIEVAEATGSLHIQDKIQNSIIFAKCWSVLQNIKHIHSLCDSTKLHENVQLREAKTHVHYTFCEQTTVYTNEKIEEI